MPANTGTPYNLPYPEPRDVPDVPADIKRLAEAVAQELGNTVALIQPPIGTILALKPGAAIPAGWVLCNGAGGTPNLAGKTLVGEGTATDGTHLAAGQSTSYVAGQVGGAAAVKLTDVTSGIGVHAHVGSTTVNIPAHSHSVPAQTVTSSSSSGAHTHTGTTNSANRNHTHTGATQSNNRSHTHGYSASQAINNTIGVAGLQDQSPNLHRGNIAIGRHTVGSGTQSANHEHGFTSDGQNQTHEHSFGTSSAGGNHNHTVAVAAKTTGSAAPVAGGTVSMSASQPKDAQQAHENRMPYYVVQYIIRIS